ncbi:hypothetical protein CHELA40_50698 [Chelatococcus asaccharovorans]|nr:hypothetical protein CHELA17_20666 [Chelatococcus asaccharovorans]CAH1693928.1 hypothetical protein CHELA40_50698 [Chelatococcus asaccharovorans]
MIFSCPNPLWMAMGRFGPGNTASLLAERLNNPCMICRGAPSPEGDGAISASPRGAP